MKKYKYSREKLHTTFTILFNIFIKKWCGDNYANLIDTDQNDGQRFRDELNRLLAIKVSKQKDKPKTKKVFKKSDIDKCIVDFPHIMKEGEVLVTKEGAFKNIGGQFIKVYVFKEEATQPQPIKEESKDIEKRDSVFYESRLKDTLLNVGFTEELLLAILKELEKVNSLTKRK